MRAIKYLVILIFMSISTHVTAIPIGTVGTYDVLIDSTTLSNSSSGGEEAWVESVIGVDINYAQIDNPGEGDFWHTVEDGLLGDYAYDFGLGLDPAFFLVKIGAGSAVGADDTTYLFENNSSLQWAFFNLDVFGSDITLSNIGIISHSGVTTVPEPGIIGLIGMGLIGLFAARRKLAR